MSKGRMEAFSDGVIAIIITIMVLDLKIPRGADLAALKTVIPGFISYVLSFIFIGIYWNNHHHLLQAAQKVSGRILWANLHLLFWLSLVPAVTAWMGQNDFASWPVSFYGIILLMAAFAYFLLSQFLIRHHGGRSALALAIGRDFKGKISLVLYALAVPLALWHPWIAYGIYISVAMMWLVPDARIEKMLSKT